MIHTFEDIISLENLCLAWREFIRGKRGKRDVREFRHHLMDNIITLHADLKSGAYHHGDYESFFVNDPKRRHIHKASVRDRLIHHAIYRILYPFFERTFIADSFSCRDDKGTHKAINRFRAMAYQVSRNHTQTGWALKCDVRKFFANIDHQILLQILRQYISDNKTIWLLKQVVNSFNRDDGVGVGLPLGNLTSQLFANVYMNRFDRFVKHKLRARYYIRYADDFVILSDDKGQLENLIPTIREFLSEKLRLTLHPNKIFLQTITSGVDFLGWVYFRDYRVLRQTTKRRMLKRIRVNPTDKTSQSYLGLLQHGNSIKARRELLNSYWFWKHATT